MALFALALIEVALANRSIVTLKILSTEVAGLFAINPSIEMPLFVVIFGGIILGVLVGFVWEWFREIKYRALAQAEHRQLVRLEREVTKLKSESVKEQNDVLALLDEVS